MKKTLIILFLAIASVAFPQEAGQQQAEVVTLRLTTDELNYVLAKLQLGPFQTLQESMAVLRLIDKIRAQVEVPAEEPKE